MWTLLGTGASQSDERQASMPRLLQRLLRLLTGVDVTGQTQITAESATVSASPFNFDHSNLKDASYRRLQGEAPQRAVQTRDLL